MRPLVFQLLLVGLLLTSSGCQSCRPISPVTFPVIGQDPLDMPIQRSGPFTWGPAYYGPLKIGGFRLGLTGYAPIHSNIEGWLQHKWMTAP